MNKVLPVVAGVLSFGSLVAPAVALAEEPVTLLVNYRQDRATSFNCPGAKPDLWPDATKWSNGASPDKDHDYLVKDNLLLTTMDIWSSHFTEAKIASTNFAFRGNSLTLGEVGKTLGHLYFNSHGYMSHGFDNDGLILANGEIRQAYANNQACNVYGKVTVTAPAKAPFSIRSTPNQTTVNSLWFRGPLLGASGTAIRYQPKEECADSILGFLGDWSGFAGVLEVTSGNLRFGGTHTMPGGVKVSGQGRFAANAVSDVLGVGSFEFSNGGTLVVSSPNDTTVASTTLGYVKVSGEYRQSGTPVISFADNQKFAFGNSKVLCRKLINVPAASADNLDPSAFVLTGLDGVFDEALGVSLKKIAESDGTFSLCLATAFADAVQQTKTEPGAGSSHNVDYGTVLTNAEAWSSGVAPIDAGDEVHYASIGYKLFTPWSDGSKGVVDFTFPGAEWTIGNGSEVGLWGKIHRMNNFHFLSGSTVRAFGYSRTAYGDWYVNEDSASGTVTLSANWSTGHWFYSNIAGYGTLRVYVMASGNNTMPKTYLMGDNSAFVGLLYTQMQEGTANAGKANEFKYPNEDHHLILYVKNGKSLGGNPPSFHGDGVLLRHYTMLSTYQEDVVLDAVNRGVKIDGTAGFIADQNSIVIKSPVNLSGTMLKQGEGALALGGAMTTSAGKNSIRVQQGSLVARSTDCLAGSAVVFEPGTKLGVVANAEDAEFSAKGFVNTCASAVTVNGDSLEVSVEPPAAAVQAWQPFSQAICTLPTAVAEAVYDKLAIQHIKRYSAKKSLVGQDGGLSTIVVDFVPTGVMMIVR